MSGVSCRDYGGGLNTKGWATGDGPALDLADLDEEVAKQVKPEKTLAEEKDAERQRWKKLRDQDGSEFAAAQLEQKKGSAAPGRPGLSSAALDKASAAVRRRELPKIMQIKRKESSEAEQAAQSNAAAKRPCAEGGAAVGDAKAQEKSAAEEPDSDSPQGGGLLAGYGSSSGEEGDDDA